MHRWPALLRVQNMSCVNSGVGVSVLYSIMYTCVKDLEDELKVVGNNLQHLEVGEEKSRSREEGRQIQIVDLQVIINHEFLV